MIDSVSSPGIDPPSPTLSARLRELASYLAAPAAANPLAASSATITHNKAVT